MTMFPAKEAMDNFLRNLANAPSRAERSLGDTFSKIVARLVAHEEATLAQLQQLIDCSRAIASSPTAAIEPAPSAKILAATIDREITARADELRRQDVLNPITQARNEAAERWGHASGAALHRWLRRNR